MQSTDGLLTAREAARRLGIKLDTLYAYVSRGLLQSVSLPGSRQRQYRAADVERFRAGRGAERGRADAAEALTPVIDSAISLIEDGRFYYRGHDAVHLSMSASLEEAAALLWGAETIPAGAAPHPGPLPLRGERESGGDGQGERLLRSLGLIERCQVRLALLSSEDMAALDLTRAGVIRTGWHILYELVAAVAGTQMSRLSVHRQLAAYWGLGDPGADLVRRCLVLLADHELNASTFVARVVASTGATPYAVVSGALSALSGRRHGGASARAEALFHEIGRDGDPLQTMAARLARDERLPGIGHPLYPAGDPRAAAIFAATAAALPAARPRLDAAFAAARRLTGEHPNVDFALAAAVTTLGLPGGAALTIFLVGRTAGWIAHAIEQYQSRVLIRPRARYAGPRPEPG